MAALLVVLVSLAVPVTASAQVSIGLSIAKIDQGFLKLLRDALVENGEALDDARIELAMADNDPDKQIRQIRAFLEAGVDAIVFLPVNSDMTDEVNTIAAEAGVPLVYINRSPPQLSFPGSVSVVTSNELVAGRVQMRMLASLSGGQGNLVVLRGEEGHPATVGRTAGVKEILAKYPGITVVHEESGGWSRDRAESIVGGLLAKGQRVDIVAANNDEMAIGAINAFKNAGVSLDTVVIGGVDGTPAGLAAMEAGHLEVSLLQDADRQAERAMKDAYKLAVGDYAQQFDWVPYELILQSNLQKYVRK